MVERDPETYAIIGAAIEVNAELGSGFLENVYLDALSRELTGRGVPFRREVELPVLYKGEPQKTTYRADLICFDRIVVEIKALKTLTGHEEAQLLNYLKVTGLQRGLLLNCGTIRLQQKRMVLGYED